jgi:hypothetical protein
VRTTPATTRHMSSYIMAALVSAAVFGPYTDTPGVRTEQVAVYGLFLVSLSCCAWSTVRITRLGALVAVLLVVETFIATLGLVEPGINSTGYATGNPVAGLDNLCLPVVVLLLGRMLTSGEPDPSRLTGVVCRIVVLAMCANAAISYLSLTRDLSPYLANFWDNSSTSDQTIAARAAQLGRFTGIFNQPAEAGVLYGVALLAAIYLYHDRVLKLVSAATVLTLGGALTVSKIFLLVALPVAAWQVVSISRDRSRRLTLVIAAVVLIAAVSQSGIVPTWIGKDYLARLVTGPTGNATMLGFYTAGRLGSAPTLQIIVSAVLKSSPWFGIGASGLAAAYDNGWVEALVVAGIAGAAIYTAVLVILGIAWFGRRHSVGVAQSRFAGGLVLVLAGASVGVPALTANRVATVVWLLISLLLFSPADGPRRVPGRATHTGATACPPGAQRYDGLRRRPESIRLRSPELRPDGLARPVDWRVNGNAHDLVDCGAAEGLLRDVDP